MCFTHFPLEIWDQVLFHLSDQDVLLDTKKDQIRCLHFLITSCRRLHSLKRHLYRYISTDQCDLFLLFRSITENPSLTGYIQALDTTVFKSSYSESAFLTIREHGISTTYSGESLYPSHQGQISALIIETLILKCKNLQELSIDLSKHSHHVHFIGPNLWKSYSLPDTLSSVPTLKTLQMNVSRKIGRNGIMIHRAQCLIYAAKPRCLHIRTMDALSICAGADAPFASVVSLEISCSSTKPSNFAALIRYCPNLCSFSYKMDETSSVDVMSDRDVIDFAGIAEALLPLANSLMTLNVHLVLNTDDEPFLLDPRAKLPNLQQLHNLKHLTIDFKSCLNISRGTGANAPPFIVRKTCFLDKLPPSLQTLSICSADSCVLPELRTLPEILTSTLPNLSQVTLKRYWGPVYENMGLRLKDRFDSSRLFFEIDEALTTAGVRLVVLSPNGQRILPLRPADYSLN